MLQTFLPLFAMTFFIVLFIVIMQFLWRYIDDLTGKGLAISTIGELFFYAALSMVPMALPLAILLASLMTFGNLGEKFELTALKASGVSLIKTMRPLIILMIGISIGAFFFQNNVLPIAQTKMWTLLYSMRQKSPEMEIPEKVFYDQIPGISLFVEKKDPINGGLYDVMIYDMSNGVDNTRIILSDSGRISMTSDKTHLLINLYNGEQFENLRSQTAGVQSNNLPHRREEFDRKDILMPFDANFNRMDESTMRNQYVGKNITELQATIDSVQQKVDSIGNLYGKEIKEKPYFGIPYSRVTYDGETRHEEVQKPVAMDRPLDVDSLFEGTARTSKRNILQQGLNRAQRVKQEYEYRGLEMEEEQKTIRRHGIELQKKFTLSFACIIFFFIGAPLGAIIRKGGFGMPLVISVFLFIVYYIIDNTGYKLARDGRLDVVSGMWLSSAVLLPLGVFLTYKALHDSSVFNFDAYKAFFARLSGKEPKRELQPKEFTMEEVEAPTAISLLENFDRSLLATKNELESASLSARFLNRVRRHEKIKMLQSQLDDVIRYMSNSRSAAVVNEINKYPYTIRLKHLQRLHEVNITLIEWFKQSMAVKG